MNAIIIDPFGWVTLTRAAELKGFARQTLADFVAELDIPTRKMKSNICVRLADIDKAIESQNDEGEGRGEREAGRQAVATVPDGRRKAIYRPPMPDAI